MGRPDRSPTTSRRGRLALAAAALAAGGLLWVVAWLRPPFCFFQRLRGEPSFCRGPGFTSIEVTIPEAGLSIRVYRPTAPAGSTLILVPGLHPQGIHDHRYQALAESCVEEGFQVVAPDIEEFRRFQIGPAVVERLTRLVEALPSRLPPESLRKVGLFGISYAGGPIMVAASRPEVARSIAFLGAIGGYYDLGHAFEYAVTGHHPGTRPDVLPAPHQWARMIFVAQNAERLASPPDAPILREALMLRLALKVEEAKEQEAGLSPAGRSFLEGVLEGLRPEEVERVRRILPEYEELSRGLSPASVVAGLDPKLRIYLVHGRGDDVIPYPETQELEAALRRSGCMRVRALVTGAFTHVDPKAGAGGWWDRARDQARLLLWAEALLDEAS